MKEDTKATLQLRMVWPKSRLAAPPSVSLPPNYHLRQFRDTDAGAYYRLMALAGFEGWDPDRLEVWRARNVRGAFFVIEHGDSGVLVATAMALHRPRPEHPEGSELGWVAADPEHKGNGLGRAVVAAATARAIHVGYENIYLLTDDHRLAAIRVYLQVGYEPWLEWEGMDARWKNIHERLAARSLSREPKPSQDRFIK